MSGESDIPERARLLRELLGDEVVREVADRNNRSGYEILQGLKQIGRDAILLDIDPDAEISLDRRQPVGDAPEVTDHLTD